MRNCLALAAMIFWGAAGSAAPWTLDVGVAATRLADAPGSRHNVLRLIPILSATYGSRLTLSLDDGLRWTALRAGRFKFGPVGEYREHVRSVQDAGFPGRGNALELGGFAEFDTPIASFEARLRRAVSGYQGLSGDISADTGGEVRPGTMLGLELRAAWADDRFVQSRYGGGLHGGHSLGPHDPDGPHYLTAGVQLAASQHLSGHLDLIGLVSEDHLLNNINSPLIKTREFRQLTLGVRYRFHGAAARDRSE